MHIFHIPNHILSLEFEVWSFLINLQLNIGIGDWITGKSECNCRAYHLYWPQDGLCYRELTQGPCPTGFKLVWNVLEEKAECECPPFWSQADDGQCYEEYSQVNCSSYLCKTDLFNHSSVQFLSSSLYCFTPIL